MRNEKYENSIPKFYNANEVANILQVSKSKAYKIMKELNIRMVNEGYITVAGKINSDYFWDCMYTSHNIK